MNKHFYNLVNLINTSYAVSKDEVSFAFTTKTCLLLLNLLKSRNYISNFSVKVSEENKLPHTNITLFYSFTGKSNQKIPHLYSLKVKSKPSFRRYVGVKELQKMLYGSCTTNYILSTSSNSKLMFADDCIAKNIGGELLLSIV